MMTSAQVVETSVNVTSNSPSQDYTHPDDHNLPNYVFISVKCITINTCLPCYRYQMVTSVCFSIFSLAVEHLT